MTFTESRFEIRTILFFSSLKKRWQIIELIRSINSYRENHLFTQLVYLLNKICAFYGQIGAIFFSNERIFAGLKYMYNNKAKKAITMSKTLTIHKHTKENSLVSNFHRSICDRLY